MIDPSFKVNIDPQKEQFKTIVIGAGCGLLNDTTTMITLDSINIKEVGSCGFVCLTDTNGFIEQKNDDFIIQKIDQTDCYRFGCTPRQPSEDFNVKKKRIGHERPYKYHK